MQATLGPASCRTDTVHRMAEAGMDGCRINMSHSSHEATRELIATVRQVAAERGRPMAVGADLRGPKLRIGEVAGGSVRLAEGSVFELSYGDRLADAHGASADYPYLAEDVRPGSPVMLNDGAILLRAEKVIDGRVICRVEKGGELSSRKGLNLPGIPLRVPSLTAKDLEDMACAVQASVDFLFLSYARSAEHLRAVRRELSRLGATLPLVAKIERQEGVDALKEIVEEADGICVARGDLGIEVPLGAVPDIQSEAAWLCRRTGKFAMMGGQVLSSMVSSPLPLRAEVSDLAAVVRDGMDAIVLSDETAAGSYPVEAVQVATEVFQRVEAGRQPGEGWWKATESEQPPEVGVVVISPDGKVAERLAASRKYRTLVAAVADPSTAAWLSTWWGVVPVVFEDLSDPVQAAQQALQRARALEPSLASLKFLAFSE